MASGGEHSKGGCPLCPPPLNALDCHFDRSYTSSTTQHTQIEGSLLLPLFTESVLSRRDVLSTCEWTVQPLKIAYGHGVHPTHLSDERESQHVQWTGQQDDINGRKVYQTSLQCAWREDGHSIGNLRCWSACNHPWKYGLLAENKPMFHCSGWVCVSVSVIVIAYFWEPHFMLTVNQSMTKTILKLQSAERVNVTSAHYSVPRTWQTCAGSNSRSSGHSEYSHWQ